MSTEGLQRRRNYLAEAYTARSTAAALEAAAERVSAAAAALTAAGHPVRYLRAVYVPEDETSFHLFEAETIEDATDVVRRAGIDCERVMEAHLVHQQQPPNQEEPPCT